MSLRARVQKLIDRRAQSMRRNFFIIAESKEKEDFEINRIKSEFVGDFSLLMITVFKLYE